MIELVFFGLRLLTHNFRWQATHFLLQYIHISAEVLHCKLWRGIVWTNHLIEITTTFLQFVCSICTIVKKNILNHVLFLFFFLKWRKMWILGDGFFHVAGFIHCCKAGHWKDICFTFFVSNKKFVVHKWNPFLFIATRPCNNMRHHWPKNVIGNFNPSH